MVVLEEQHESNDFNLLTFIQFIRFLIYCIFFFMSCLITERRLPVFFLWSIWIVTVIIRRDMYVMRILPIGVLYIISFTILYLHRDKCTVYEKIESIDYVPRECMLIHVVSYFISQHINVIRCILFINFCIDCVLYFDTQYQLSLRQQYVPIL